MEPWDGWPYQRAYLLLVAVAFGVVGAQVLLYHGRAAFRAKTMYVPVALTPVLVAAGVAAAVTRNDATGWFAAGTFGVGVLVGIVGLVLHLRGIASRVGGYTLRNVMAGPPPLLPLAFAALALTGGLAVLWETL